LNGKALLLMIIAQIVKMLTKNAKLIFNTYILI